MRKVILPGACGFLGLSLLRHLRQRGWEVVVLSRREAAPIDGVRVVRWDGRHPGPWTTEFEDSDLVVNLCGRSVDCRYTAENRRLILDSRLESTRAIGQAIAACRRPPPLWINSSSATVYRHAEDREMTESDGEIGTGFSVDVVQQWEKEFFVAPTPQTRRVALRTAMVLGLGDGGVFRVLSRLVRWGLGGTMGNGRQYVSWLHEADFAAIIDWLMANDTLDGPINACAPYPVPNRELMKVLRRAYGRPFGLPASRLMLEVGAWGLRTETELILKSRRVVPERLLDSGYRFRFSTIEKAVEDLVRKRAGETLL